MKLTAALIAFMVAVPEAAIAQRPDAVTTVDFGFDVGVREIFLSPAGQGAWGPNLYRIPRGTNHGSIPLPQSGPCVFDVQIVYSDASVERLHNMNFCDRNSTVLYLGCAGQSFCTKSGPAPAPRPAPAPAPSSSGRARNPAAEAAVKGCLAGTGGAAAIAQSCSMAVIHMEFLPGEAPRVHTAYGRAEHNRGDYEKAIKQFGVALELGSTDPFTYSFRAASHLELRNYDAAERDGRESLRLKPDHASGHNVIGLAHRYRRNYAEAIKSFTRAMEIDPRSFTFVSNRGVAKLLDRQWQAAIADLEASLAINPKYPFALFARGVARKNLGDAGGDADLAAARAINKDIDAAMASRGVTVPAAVAAPAAGDAAPTPESQVKALTRQAHDAFDRGDFDAAYDIAESALKVIPGYTHPVLADALNIQGVVSLRRQQFDRAATLFSLASLADESQDTYFANLAYAWFRAGKTHLVGGTLDQALAIQPRNADALFMRGVLKLTKGDRAGGDADLKAARAIRPGIDDAMAKLGVVVPQGRR